MIITHICRRTVGKATSVGWHAHALHERGYQVTALEANHSRRLAEWGVLAGGSPFPAQQQRSALFHKNVPPTLKPGRIAILGCGHVEGRRTIVASVLRVADLAVLNAAPSRGDIDRIERMPMHGFIKDVSVLGAVGEAPEAWVLFNRTTSRPREAAKSYRDHLIDSGWDVFDTAIPNQQLHAQPMPSAITAECSAYADLADEMFDRGMLPKTGDVQ